MSFFRNRKLGFKWYEEKTVASGANSFTLTNTVPVGAVLKISDSKYGVEWDLTAHWTRSGQVVTLTESSLAESLTFQIWCYV